MSSKNISGLTWFSLVSSIVLFVGFSLLIFIQINLDIISNMGLPKYVQGIMKQDATLSPDNMLENKSIFDLFFGFKFLFDIFVSGALISIIGAIFELIIIIVILVKIFKKKNLKINDWSKNWWIILVIIFFPWFPSLFFVDI